MKKIIALALALAMILPCLVSCGNEPAAVVDTEGTSASTAAETEEYRFDYIDEYIDGLVENGTYDGAEFMVLTDTDWQWPEDEITGVLVDDATYARNREIEEKFNIDFTAQVVDGTGYVYAPHEAADRLKTDIMAGFSTYDLVISSIMICGVSSLSTGVIRPVDDMDGIDPSQSWWMRDIYDQFCIDDSLYFLTGKMCGSHYGSPQCILFNKQMMEDYGVEENLYELVESGEWTADKMNEIASVVPAGGEHFRYLHGGNIGGLALYFGGGFRICEKDESGNPVFPTSLTTEQVDYIEKLERMIGDSSVARDAQKWSHDHDFPDGYEIFSEDIYMFSQEWMGSIEYLRDTDLKFGILPMPKKDTAQENYYAFASAWGIGGAFIPTNLSDEKMTGYITEAMAALSEKHIEPAYYEKNLKGRSAYDLESRSMLDIIYNSVVIDLSDIYQDQWGEIVYIINNNVVGYSDTLVSSYNAAAKVGNKMIQRLIKQIQSRK